MADKSSTTFRVTRSAVRSSTGLSIVTVRIKDQYDKTALPQVWDELRRKVGDVQSQLPPNAGPSDHYRRNPLPYLTPNFACLLLDELRRRGVYLSFGTEHICADLAGRERVTVMHFDVPFDKHPDAVDIPLALGAILVHLFGDET